MQPPAQPRSGSAEGDVDREVLVARNGSEVAERLSSLTGENAHSIGEAARARILSEHTYAHRAEQVEAVIDGKVAAAVEASR